MSRFSYFLLFCVTVVLCFPSDSKAQSVYQLEPAGELNPQIPAQELYEYADAGQKSELRFSYESQDKAIEFIPVNVRQEAADGGGNSFFNTISETPGLAFLSSALVPGLGQAAHRQWWRTALYAGIEIGAIYVGIDQQNRGDRLQREYNQYANEHWSVVQYAQFLTRYTQLDMNLEDVLTERGLTELQNNGYLRPSFNNETDWGMIDLRALNDFERQTLYRSSGRAFSHVVPGYGSQQYYELVSKYFQFGPGWRDWNRDLTIVDGGVADMPATWQYHTSLEETFNDAKRLSRNMGMILLANHVFSAFDALFTSTIRAHRAEVESTASLGRGGRPQVQVSVNF